MHLLIIVVATLLALPAPATAESDLMRSARRLAVEVGRAGVQVDQAQGCGAARDRGAAAANRRQSRLGWTLASIGLPVIGPVLAHRSTPQPPAADLRDVALRDRACYVQGYQVRARQRRVQASWGGTVAAFVVMAVVMSADRDGIYYPDHDPGFSFPWNRNQ